MVLRPWVAVAALSTLLFVALAGCSSSPSTGASSSPAAGGKVAHVDITNRAYSPGSPHVATGTSVTFQNHDAFKHSLSVHDVGQGAQINDADIAANGQTTFTFPHAGTYHLTCKYHSSMFAEVTAS